MAWYRRWPFIAGVTLIVLTNVVALGGVMRNRSGAPDSTLTLTERELALPYSAWEGAENSGLALRLLWRVDESQGRSAAQRMVHFGGEADWLNAAKLAGLGIRVHPRSSVNGASYSTSLPADVLLVLEMNGAVYRQQLERACRLADHEGDKDAVQACARERSEASRLFVVDAGLDRDALRRQYPDTKVHAIVRGQIQAAIVPTTSNERLVGYVSGVSTDEIQVPAPMRSALGVSGNMTRWPRGGQTSPFTATVAFGRRLEPWIVSLSPNMRNR